MIGDICNFKLVIFAHFEQFKIDSHFGAFEEVKIDPTGSFLLTLGKP